MAPPRTVDEQKIVAAALAIADEEGVAAVSMRNVSQRLGVVATALYRHVASKEELLSRMADSVLATLPELRDDVDWRPAVVDLFVSLRDLMIEHHGLAELMLLRSTGAPVMLAAAERVLQAMQNDGIPVHSAVTTLAMLQWSTLGAASHSSARRTRPPEALPPAIADAAPDAFPALARAGRELPEGARRAQFRDGLHQLLAGLQPGGGTARPPDRPETAVS